MASENRLETERGGAVAVWMLMGGTVAVGNFIDRAVAVCVFGCPVHLWKAYNYGDHF